MKALRELLSTITIQDVYGDPDGTVAGLALHTDDVALRFLFAALPGTKYDGHTFIAEAIKRGATTILCERIPDDRVPGITYILVDDSIEAIGVLASAFYNHPSQKLKLVGVTGTNGKTTTATLLWQLFTQLGYTTGLLSTIENRIGATVVPSSLTTADSITINRLLARMVDEHCTHAFMEVSSHAVVGKRITGLEFTGGVFTNITHDHIDFHQTFEAYLAAKRAFFDTLHTHAFAVANNDDENGAFMLQNTKAATAFYGLTGTPDVKGFIRSNDLSGLSMTIDGQEVSSKLIGHFNAYNLLAVYATALQLQEDPASIIKQIPFLRPVRGRFEWIAGKDGRIGIIDYAHTPDAVENVLQTINDIALDTRNIITVIGCGGDRDTAKRPQMAKLAHKLSTYVILTADNPRSEEPLRIIADMQAGIVPYDETHVFTIPDRKAAIAEAVSLSQPGDIVAVLGKGHETYQEIAGQRYDFDDRAELEKLL